MITELRQLLFPKEFRIKKPGTPSDNIDLEKVLEKYKEVFTNSTPPESIDNNFIKEMATSIWRLEKRIKELPEELLEDRSIRRSKRAMDMIIKGLKNREIEIRDYSGTKYDPDESWDEVGGDNVEDGTIKKMGKPRVIYQGVVIQKGIPIIEKN